MVRGDISVLMTTSPLVVRIAVRLHHRSIPTQWATITRADSRSTLMNSLASLAAPAADPCVHSPRSISPSAAALNRAPRQVSPPRLPAGGTSAELVLRHKRRGSPTRL